MTNTMNNAVNDTNVKIINTDISEAMRLKQKYCKWLGEWCLSLDSGELTYTKDENLIFSDEDLIWKQVKLNHVIKRINNYRERVTEIKSILTNQQFNNMQSDWMANTVYATSPSHKPPKLVNFVITDKMIDIVEMSMRGLKSCQSWSYTDSQEQVFNNLLDKNMCVAYLESGKGKILARAILRRIVVDKTVCIGVDRYYGEPTYRKQFIDKITNQVLGVGGMELVLLYNDFDDIVVGSYHQIELVSGTSGRFIKDFAPYHDAGSKKLPHNRSKNGRFAKHNKKTKRDRLSFYQMNYKYPLQIIPNNMNYYLNGVLH